MLYDENKPNGNMVILEPNFQNTLESLRKINLSLPSQTKGELDFTKYSFPPNGDLITPLEEIKPYTLDAKKGEYDFFSSLRRIYAYDESMIKYSCLEGTAYLLAHSLVEVGENDYYPTGLLTFNFYTRSQLITDRSNTLKFSLDPEMDSKKDYIKSKIEILTKYTPVTSLLLIDGPLIGGDVYTYMIRAIEEFLAKDIIPIFFVKNSTSNLVTDNVNELRGKYNSDMHWSFSTLKNGQRTSFFKYGDKNNPNNAKIFCYIKSLNTSPQRIEFHVRTFEKYRDEIENIMNIIYYLILVQGDLKNPQVRPIAIAEFYARELIRLCDINKYLNSTNLVPTLNQERFGW